MTDEWYDKYKKKIDDKDLYRFYEDYKAYSQNNNVFSFDSKKRKNPQIQVKVSFGLKPSEGFLDQMETGINKVQKALDDLRTELYMYLDE